MVSKERSKVQLGPNPVFILPVGPRPAARRWQRVGLDQPEGHIFVKD